MHTAAITGTGVFTPEQVITNAELVVAFNAYAERYNAENADAIASGALEAKAPSSEDFIVKASGIEQRYVIDKTGILDPAIMHPILPQRDDDAPSLMAEMALDAADVDLVICAASNLERAYPAVAIEIQQLLGVQGFAFDMNVACSSATFGLQAAADMIRAGSIRKALVVNPEICSAHLEWRDRDCHFIFGDVATATVVERAEDLFKQHPQQQRLFAPFPPRWGGRPPRHAVHAKRAQGFQRGPAHGQRPYVGSHGRRRRASR